MINDQRKVEAQRLAKRTFNELLDKRPKGTYIIAFRNRAFFVNNIKVRTSKWHSRYYIGFGAIFENMQRNKEAILTSFEQHTGLIAPHIFSEPFVASDGVYCLLIDAREAGEYVGAEA